MVNSKEIMEKDARYLAPTYRRKPIVIYEGKGAVLNDVEGREYVDCLSGISVTNAGHCPERVVKAASEQLSRLIHCSGFYYSVPQTLLAEKLSQITPEPLTKTFFCNSGAEAVEGATKLAKKHAVYRGKTGMGMISLEGSFHGRLGMSLTLTAQAKYKKGFGTFACHPGVAHAPAPYCYRCPLTYPDCGLECVRRVHDVVKYHTSGDVAAMIVEPIMGEGGIIVPPDDYLSGIRKVCDEHDMLLIIDEVQTGIGRTGKMFASEIWGIHPDIMIMAKGLGAGLPIGAVIYSDKVLECLEYGDHFSTFGGNPVSCAAALENLKYLEDEGLVENAERVGSIFMEGLREIQERHSIIGDVRGKGLMIGLELVKDPESKTPAVEETQKVADKMMADGVLVGTGGVFKNVVRIQPPLCITEEQAKLVLSKLEEKIASL
ncbi:MAG: aspartate aminotransferase family protein [Candidatus Thorarchaeota archaeon]